MAIKNYIVKNKKKSTCLLLVLIMCMVSIFAIVNANKTNAGVFKDDGGVKVQVDEIKVLEIVAREGEQVLGYTVEGQEPISVSDIETYRGTMDLDDAGIEDFKNATGYIIEKVDTGDTDEGGNPLFSYKVKDDNKTNILNHTFNDNVLGSSMSVGEIKVEAKQASDVRVRDIEWADLIYINSNDYNDNLLYYYDQFVNHGNGGINLGDRGESFTGTYQRPGERQSTKISNIILSAGNINRVANLTADDFEFVQLALEGDDEVNFANFKDYNTEYYKDKLANEIDDAYFSDDTDEAVKQLNEKFAEWNISSVTDAENFLKNTLLDIKDDIDDGNKVSVLETLENDEQLKEQIINAFKRMELNYSDENYEEYIQDIDNYMGSMLFYDFKGFFDTISSEQALDAMDSLAVLRNEIIEKLKEGIIPPDPAYDVDEIYMTSDEVEEFIKLLKKSNQGEINDFITNEYIGEFFGTAYDSFGGASDSEMLRDMIDLVNNSEKDDVRRLIANILNYNSEGSKHTFMENPVTYFEIAQIPGYNRFYSDEYIVELWNMAGKYDAHDGNGHYDLDKLEKFISDVNKNANATELVDTSCDISWKAASEIISRVFGEEVALMYNTELLTGQYKIGDYNKKDADDNTNNVYKMLLVTRQLRDSYYADGELGIEHSDIASKIDKDGVYYPNGLEDETGKTSSWSKYTFADANLFDSEGNVSSIDYTKYHEPDVVGDTFDINGTQGNSVNYVYKKIYSYTGNEFFGGKNFSNPNTDMSSFTGVVTSGAGYHEGEPNGVQNTDSQLDIIDGNNEYIFVDISQSGWSNVYAYFWLNTEVNTGKPLPMKKLDGSIYYAEVPNYATNVLFAKQEGWSNDANTQTKDLSLPAKGSIDGTQYYINGSSGNKKNATIIEPMSIVFLTNSIYYNSSSTPAPDNTSNQVKYTGSVDLKVKACNADNIQWAITNTGNGQYTLVDVGDTITLDPANHPEQIDGNGRTIIALKYNNTLNNTETNKSYYYYKYSEPGYVNITNFINGGVVEYCGNMDITASYNNVTDFKYSDNGGSTWMGISNGSTISFGGNEAEETKKEVMFQYKIGGSNRTIKTTLYKRNRDNVKPKLNYLSENTATNGGPLGYDNTLTTVANNIVTGGNKGDIIRYIMDVTINEASSYPINVLEIQPAAGVNEYASYEGAKELADLLNIDVFADDMGPDNYKDYINVTYMSVKEFNTRNEDLTAEYDLIYFGVNSGYQVVDDNGRTKYNDTAMNGLVYTGIGDEYVVRPFLRGIAADDYNQIIQGLGGNTDRAKEYRQWNNYFTSGFKGNDNSNWNINDFGTIIESNSAVQRPLIMKNEYTTTRLGGNDITVKRMEDLLEYLKSGYPILLDDKIMNCDSSDYIDYSEDSSAHERWRYVDVNSKMYNFIVEAKSLGYNAATGTYSDNSVFYDGKPYASLVSVSNAKFGGNPEYLSTDEKFEGGLSFAYKRNSKLDFEYLEGPKEYGKDDNGNDLPKGSTGRIIGKDESDYKSYTITIGVKRSGGATKEELDNYGYRGYIDKSGVGKFEDDARIDLECNYKYNLNSEGKVKSITITGNWPGAVEGFIPWRIEVYNKNNENSKFSYTGYSSFEMANQEVKDVYVLWIRPKTQLTLDFREVLMDNDDSNGVIANYKIHLITMSYDNFTNMYNNNPASSSFVNDVGKQYDENTSLLKVQYVYNHRGNSYNLYNINNAEVASIDPDKALDMIVIGFSDSHEEMDIKSIAALKDIDYFLDAGHSLLFSHDNAGFHSSLNYYINTGGTTVNPSADNAAVWGRYTTSYLRQRLGMDQFGITYGGSSDNLPAEYSNARKYIDTTNAHDYRGITETCVFHYNSIYAQEGTTWGSKNSAIQGNKLYSKTIGGTAPSDDIKGWCHTKQIMRTNEGQITNYPFIIGDYVKDVANTHAQYNTLNLEDADTTVWYVLDNDGTQPLSTQENVYYHPEFYTYTKGDGTNNYYIYSKGNITYTGAGHSDDFKDTEKKLFINTVIASLKSGNYEPEVNVVNAYTDGTDKCIDYIKDSSGVAVIFRPIDYDMRQGTEAFTDCKIYLDYDGDGKYTDGVDIMLNNDGDENAAAPYMHAPNGTDPINFVGSTLSNRNDHTFFITSGDKDNINAVIASKGGTGTIFDYKIVIQVSDQGYLKAKNPIPATTSTSFKLVEKEEKKAELFNLD